MLCLVPFRVLEEVLDGRLPTPVGVFAREHLLIVKVLLASARICLLGSSRLHAVEFQARARVLGPGVLGPRELEQAVHREVQSQP